MKRLLSKSKSNSSEPERKEPLIAASGSSSSGSQQKQQSKKKAQQPHSRGLQPFIDTIRSKKNKDNDEIDPSVSATILTNSNTTTAADGEGQHQLLHSTQNHPLQCEFVETVAPLSLNTRPPTSQGSSSSSHHGSSNTGTAATIAEQQQSQYTPPTALLPQSSNQDYTTNHDARSEQLLASVTPLAGNTTTPGQPFPAYPYDPNQQLQQQGGGGVTLGEPSRSMDEEEQGQLLKNSDMIATKIPSNHFEFLRATLIRSGLIYFLVFLVTAAGMVYGVSDTLRKSNNIFQRIDWDMRLNVAFLGNAYLFVNDMPRLLEAVSEGKVYQNSCIHAGGSLSDLWITGNGMYGLWKTEEAEIEYTTDDDGGGTTLRTTYDYGLCTVAQTLQGYDEYIAYGNQYGHYYDDGLNPCISNQYYASFLSNELVNDPVSWDYVVLADQTKRMAVPQARNSTVSVLTNGYGPMLKVSGAVPVIVDTHAFWSSSSNMTGLVDIPTFTKLLYQGVDDYVSALAKVLPKRQAPLVAPVGLAYLTVWEEERGLWKNLFLDDGIHASMHGSYLFALILYCTLFRHLPVETDDFEALFMDARKIVGQPEYPDEDEMEYMRNVAQRVALRNYVPSSFRAVQL